MSSDQNRFAILAERQRLIRRAADACPININPLTDWWRELAPLTRPERITARQAAAMKVQHDAQIQQHGSIIGKSRR